MPWIWRMSPGPTGWTSRTSGRSTACSRKICLSSVAAPCRLSTGTGPTNIVAGVAAGPTPTQPWTQPESARETFEDIETLAAGCHFTDCRHREEPRCAVKQAIEDGTLAPGRLDSYVKLQDESQALEMRKNVRDQINVKRKFKTVSQSMKKFYGIGNNRPAGGGAKRRCPSEAEPAPPLRGAASLARE